MREGRRAPSPRCAPAGVQYEDPLTTEPLNRLEAAGAARRAAVGCVPRCAAGANRGQAARRSTSWPLPCKALGTHREPLEGLPATNRFVVVHCIFYCELQHELLLRVRGFYDVYDAATQLGVLPARGTLGEKALLMLRGFGLRGGRA